MDSNEAKSFLHRVAYTNEDEKDPTKPLILEDGLVRANPNFDPGLVDKMFLEEELARRETSLGTSFFLNFDPLCNLHKIRGNYGNSAREAIVFLMRERFLEVFRDCFGDNPPPLEALNKGLEVQLCRHEQIGFNNGEIYFWLPGLIIKEEIIIKILLAFKKSLEDNPVPIKINDQEYFLLFYGWGWRHI